MSQYKKEVERVLPLIIAERNPLAIEQLNRMYEDPKAVKWFRDGGEQGDVVAQFMLGRMFILGLGVAKNEDEATKWFRKAAEQGYAPAQFNLGAMYGRHYPDPKKDYTTAFKWYKKAAEQGHGQAQCAVGLMYKTGTGTTKDLQEAEKWLERAAQQGDQVAKKELHDISAPNSEDTPPN